MGGDQSFAQFALSRLPGLARRLARRDVARWLAGQDGLLVDGERRWLIWGDRLVDEAEMKLDWARSRGLVDEAVLAALQNDYGCNDPDVEAITVAPVPET
jgi:hypothetical protein